MRLFLKKFHFFGNFNSLWLIVKRMDVKKKSSICNWLFNVWYANMLIYISVPSLFPIEKKTRSILHLSNICKSMSDLICMYWRKKPQLEIFFWWNEKWFDYTIHKEHHFKKSKWHSSYCYCIGTPCNHALLCTLC